MNKSHHLFALNSEWLDKYSTKQKDIVKNYHTLLHYLEIPNPTIPKHIFEDVSMFRSKGVFEKIDHTITLTGKIYLQYIITNPCHNKTLLARQQFIQYDSNHNDILDNIYTCKTIDQDINWFIQKIDKDQQQYLDILLFTHKYSTFLNQCLPIVTILNIFKLWIVPLQLVISPILILVAPYIVIRYYLKLKISVPYYLKLLKFLLYDIKKMNILNGKAKLWTLLSVFGSIFAFVQNIWSNIQLCNKIHALTDLIHQKLSNISRLIRTVYDMSKKFKAHEFLQFKPKYSYRYLMNSIFTKKCSIFRDKGRIIWTYSRFMSEFDGFKDWLLYFSKIDAYMAIGTLSRLPGWQFSRYVFDTTCTPYIHIRKMWHPMINKSKPNNMHVGVHRPNNILITGPNAGGKSTYIKNVLLCILLSQTLTISPCVSIRFTPFHIIESYIHIADEEGHESLFEAEMYRCKHYLDMLANNKNKYFFIVMDELFNSTTPIDGISGAYGILKKIGKYKNNIACITTHFQYLTRLQKKTTAFTNYKMTVHKYPDRISYPYTLYKGISNQYIALELLHKKGFDPSIIKQAIKTRNKIQTFLKY